MLWVVSMCQFLLQKLFPCCWIPVCIIVDMFVTHVRWQLVLSFAAVAQQQALLDSEVASFRQATFGESTQIRTFIRFCIYFGYTPVPASTETRVRYSVFLARTHVASSVKQNLNVVRIIHLARGLKTPLEGSFHLKCVLKEITRMRGRAPERKLPITPVILRMFHRYIDVWCS